MVEHFREMAFGVGYDFLRAHDLTSGLDSSTSQLCREENPFEHYFYRVSSGFGIQPSAWSRTFPGNEFGFGLLRVLPSRRSRCCAPTSEADQFSPHAA
jgi:hypothetical protein